MKTIYLDQSDFSYFATQRTEEPHASLRALLLSLRDSGTVQLPFSYVHLAESLQVEPQYREHALARAREMKAICGSLVFDHPVNVWKAEKEAALTDRNYPSGILRSDGRWFPGFDISNMFAERAAPFGFLKHYSRKERRAYNKTIRNALGALMDDVGARIPGGASVVRPLLEAWMFGDLDGNALESELTAQFYDPERIVAAANLGLNALGDLRGQIDRLGSAFSTMYEGLGDIFDDWDAKFAALKIESHQAGSLAQEVFRNRALQENRKARISLFRTLAPEVSTDEQALRLIEGCPGFSLVMAFKERRFLDLMDARLAGQETKRGNKPGNFRSDAGDALHLTYLPYVDYFRCDRDTRNLLLRIAPQLAQKCFNTPQALFQALQPVT